MKESNIMDKERQAISNDLAALAEDAQALMAATADVAGDKIGEARKRLAAALESSKEMYGRAREKTAEGVRVADQTVREHPYQAIGIALGVGALAGFLIGWQCSRND